MEFLSCSRVCPPARAPELNPVENIWHFLRENWLSSRVFASYRDIVDHCCGAWNRLIDQPWLIMSIGLRDWANASTTSSHGRMSARCSCLAMRRGRGSDNGVITRSNSLCYQQDPTSSNHQEHRQEEEGYEESEAVEFELRQISTAHEDDILAATLWRNDRKITAREQ